VTGSGEFHPGRGRLWARVDPARARAVKVETKRIVSDEMLDSGKDENLFGFDSYWEVFTGHSGYK
jgi:hypothetical protein